MTHCTIVCGATAREREAMITALIDAEPAKKTAVIIEGGIESGSRFALAPDTEALAVRIIAAGCPCCNDGLVMRVTLDRVLQQRPALLYIVLMDESHATHLQKFLLEPPYCDWVTLAPPIFCNKQHNARTA